MGYSIRAQAVEACSCKMACRCTLGPAEPDQGWCSGAFGYEVVEGSSEGTDLSGVKFLLLVDLPGDFLGGIDVARAYIDEGASEEQRRELEAVLHGERGGNWGGVRDMIGKWLPTKVAAIAFQDGDAPSVAIDGVGKSTLEPLMTQSGKRATIQNAPVAEALGQEVIELAVATGSKWSDPDMRGWESLGYGQSGIQEWNG